MGYCIAKCYANWVNFFVKCKIAFYAGTNVVLHMFRYPSIIATETLNAKL